MFHMFFLFNSSRSLLWLLIDQEHHLNVAEVRVTYQPAGALFDYVLDAEGEIIPERRSA